MAQRPQNFRINRNAPLAKGLVFAGLGGYRCPGTSLFADSSLFGNHGTLTNMDPATDWVWVPELGRWGLDFDGDEFVNAPILTPTTAVTFAGWLNSSQTSTLARLFDCRAIGGDNNGFYLNVTSRVLAFVIDSSTGFSSFQASQVSPVGNTSWYHCAATWNGEQVVVYVNGTAGGGGAKAGTVAGLRTSMELCESLIGLVSDLGVWSRALSDAEISALADPSNAMLSGLILPPKRRLWPVVTSSPTNPVPVFMHHYATMRA